MLLITKLGIIYLDRRLIYAMLGLEERNGS